MNANALGKGRAMSTVVVSRGFLDRSAARLLRAVPLIENPTVVLSVCSGRICGFGESHSSRRPPTGDAYEEIVKTGNFTNESLRAIVQLKPSVVVISQEAGQPGSLARLASDGVCLLTRSRTPVLLLPTVCSAPRCARIVIGAVYGRSSSADDGNSVSELLDLGSAEVVVLVVASLPHRPFLFVVVGTRGRRLKAIQDEREHQITGATAQAGLIAAQLARGSRPISVGRVGRFVDEICHVTQCADTSLVCLLIGRRARRCLSKQALLGLLEKTNAPIMLVPSAGK